MGLLCAVLLRALYGLSSHDFVRQFALACPSCSGYRPFAPGERAVLRARLALLLS